MIDSENQQPTFLSRFLQRFIFLYLVLYIFPYGFEYVQELKPDDISFWQGITVWFGEWCFGWDMNEDRLSKGFDSMYDYSRFVLIAVLSVLGAFIWMFVDTITQKQYTKKLKTLTRTILRYHVGLTLIVYGLAKVFMLQFGEMDLNRLERTVGNTDGMGFLWSFMSFSKLYTMTTGWIEVVGGVLLLFRRTTFLGAFILFISMVTVVLIDIGYDVRVKMFAIHLLLMTILILIHDAKRLFDFFIFNKPTTPSIETPLFSNGKYQKIGYAMKYLLLLYFTGSCIFNNGIRIQNQKGDKYPSLTRYHTVKSHVLNGDTLPESHPKRWKGMTINGSSYSSEDLQLKVGLRPYPKYYTFTADTLQQIIKAKSRSGLARDTFEVHYTVLPDKKYVFEGISGEGDTIRVETVSKTLEDYPLISNSGKWITDLKYKEDSK